MRNITKWEDCPREDLKNIPLALSLGWSLEFSSRDKTHKRTEFSNVPHDAVTFEKGIYHIWYNYRLDKWQIGKLENASYNQIKDRAFFDTLEEALKYKEVKKMEAFHILQIKTLGATDTLPVRISIKSQRFQQHVVIPWNNEAGETLSHWEVSARYLQSKGFEIIGKGEGNSDYDYLITSTFEPLRP